jgi:hypothetical protein
MNVKAIVKKYLTENGYDGLYKGECGCRKNDLIACGGPAVFCRPGYFKWGKDPWGDREWSIVPKKEG